MYAQIYFGFLAPNALNFVRHRLVYSTAFAAETLPLPFVSTAIVAKTVPLPCGSPQVLMAAVCNLVLNTLTAGCECAQQLFFLCLSLCSHGADCVIFSAFRSLTKLQSLPFVIFHRSSAVRFSACVE